MPDLNITVEKAAAVPFAVSPTLAFELRVANANPEEAIHTVVLRCQIQVEVARRPYSAAEQERLRDLFGEPERWGQTLRSMLWTHANAVVPSFQGSTTVQLQVPCTFDFNIAATKYFNGLTVGEIPLCLMFSGTVFYADHRGTVQVAPMGGAWALAVQVNPNTVREKSANVWRSKGATPPVAGRYFARPSPSIKLTVPLNNGVLA